MNRNTISLICALGIVLGSALTAMGAGFQTLGMQATSMGGAGVAYSSGSYAAYYNPALLAVHKYGLEMSLAPRIAIREHNLADHIDTLADINVEETLNRLTEIHFDAASLLNSLTNGTPISSANPILSEVRQNLQTIQTELLALSEGNALEIMPGASLGVQVRSLGFGVFGLSDFAASAVVDTQRLDIIVPVTADGTTYYVEYNPTLDTFTARDETYYGAHSLHYALDFTDPNNPDAQNHQTTTIKMSGIAYVEIPIAYGYQFKTAGGDLNIGGSFKIMSGRTFQMLKPIGTESGDILENIKNSDKTTTTFGLDAGVLFNPSVVDNLSIGMLMKNFNNPKFDYIDGTQLELKPQVRFGAAYSTLFDRLTFAMDLDLTKNESLVPGLYERYIGGGVDFHPFSWFSVRAGVMKNLEKNQEGVIPTAGLGFGAKWFQFDISAQYGSKKGTYSDTKVPRYGSIQASFVSRWF
jgi:hypothetical protein